MTDSAPEWITTTSRAVRLAGDAVHAHDELKVVNNALRDLEQIRADVEILAAAGILGRGSWWSGLVVNGSLPPGAEISDDELERRRLPGVVRELKELTRRAQKSLQEAWRNHVNSRVRNVGELRELVNLLADGGQLASVAAELKRALASLPSLEGQIPDSVSVDNLEKIVALIAAFEAALPTTVRAFITATARGGASITMLNTDVVKWLHDNDAVENFKVTAGKPSGVARG